jgi:trk system potassium uptake protein TrkH
VSFTILLCALLIVETDFYSAYTALIATFSNTGPALGKAASDYSTFSPYAKWVLSFAMILGRLEIFTILVLMAPLFWRR